MTVAELIRKLEEVENKELVVYGWHTDLDIEEIVLVDELDDRVDLNLDSSN